MDDCRTGDIHEERLLSMSGLRQASLALTSWRGRSGRRYVVGVHGLTESDILALTEAVILAVKRDADGSACVIAVATTDSEAHAAARRAWLGIVRERGAIEMHVHRLAEGAEERRSTADDLSESRLA